LDGQVQIISRPKLTRATLLSPLPGSAITPALALAKKEKSDLRVAEFQVASAGWSFSTGVHPDLLSLPRQIAQRINAIASNLAHAASRSPAAQVIASTPPPTYVLDQLERVAELERSGSISKEQADLRRSRLIG